MGYLIKIKSRVEVLDVNIVAITPQKKVKIMAWWIYIILETSVQYK